MEGLFEDKQRFRHLMFAYGTFDFDDGYVQKEYSLYDIEEWLLENHIGEYSILYTFASYMEEGIKDVTVFAFEEEADAMAFKLRWS